MSIVHEQVNGVEVVRIDENLMLAGVKSAKSIIKPLVGDGSVDKILVNLDGVSMIDSSGIGFLVGSLNAAKKNSIQFAICNASGFVLETFKSTHLDTVLTISASEEEGLAAFK